MAHAHGRRRGGAGNHLHYLPFAALRFDNVGEGPPRLHLSQRSRLVVEPAAGFVPLVYALQRPDRRESAIVLGDPTGDLHGSETEASAHSCAPKPRATLCFAATVPACFTSLRMANTTPATRSYHESQLADGRLTADDLIERGPAASLAVFSGCVTGLAERCPGDELIGLARAAPLAGIPSVVTTLWRTRDESGAPFFRAFYDAVCARIPSRRRAAPRAGRASPQSGNARSRALGSLCPHGRLALTRTGSCLSDRTAQRRPKGTAS